jgi:hypothetical protein
MLNYIHTNPRGFAFPFSHRLYAPHSAFLIFVWLPAFFMWRVDKDYFLSCNQTRPHATVEVEISEDMQLVHFDFNR